MKNKFQKISWGCDETDGHEKYVIIRRLDESSPELIHYLETNSNIPEVLMSETEPYVWGILIYGSSIKYGGSGRLLYFRQAYNITDLNDEEVIQQHFVGLI